MKDFRKQRFGRRAIVEVKQMLTSFIKRLKADR